jgi:hypothetical protein
VKVKERVKGKEVESESERACDFTDVGSIPRQRSRLRYRFLGSGEGTMLGHYLLNPFLKIKIASPYCQL